MAGGPLGRSALSSADCIKVLPTLVRRWEGSPLHQVGGWGTNPEVIQFRSRFRLGWPG